MALFEAAAPSPTLDRDFADYLKGKTAAIVGRSGIHDIEQGEFIDSHDVVVRMHRVVPYNPSDATPQANWESPGNDPIYGTEFVPPEWHPIVGRKTNIFYHRLQHYSDSDKYLRWMDKFRASGGEFLCQDGMFGLTTWKAYMIGEHFPVRHIPPWLRDKICREIKGGVEAGTLAIADILRHDIKSAYITGFPCMLDSFIDDKSPFSPKKMDKHPRRGNYIKPTQVLNFRYIHDMVKSNGAITADSTMNKLFDMLEAGDLDNARD